MNFALRQTMKPCISIIIATHNREKYVVKAIDAIRSQPFTAWELVVVDDGSLDRTAEVVSSIASTDARVKYIYQANAGLSAARNTGKAAIHPDSQFLMFHDDDDWLTENALGELMALADAHPEAPAVIGLPRHCDDTGFSTEVPANCYGARRMAVGRYGLPINVPFESPETFASMVVWCGIATSAQALIRRDAFEKTGGYVESVKISEDWLMWIDLTRQGDIPRTGTFTLNKRVHYGAVTQNGKVMLSGEPSVRNEVLLLKGLTSRQRLLSMQGYCISSLANISWAFDDFRNCQVVSGFKQMYRMLKRIFNIMIFWATIYRRHSVVQSV